MPKGPAKCSSASLSVCRQLSVACQPCEPNGHRRSPIQLPATRALQFAGALLPLARWRGTVRVVAHAASAQQPINVNARRMVESVCGSQTMPRRFQQMIVGIQRAGLGPDSLCLVLLTQLPQHFAQVRRNVAIVIVRIRRV